MVLQNLLLSGDFIDYIYDQPDNLHELVTTSDISGILKALKAAHKQLIRYELEAINHHVKLCLTIFLQSDKIYIRLHLLSNKQIGGIENEESV